MLAARMSLSRCGRRAARASDSAGGGVQTSSGAAVSSRPSSSSMPGRVIEQRRQDQQPEEPPVPLRVEKVPGDDEDDVPRGDAAAQQHDGRPGDEEEGEEFDAVEKHVCVCVPRGSLPPAQPR